MHMYAALIENIKSVFTPQAVREEAYELPG